MNHPAIPTVLIRRAPGARPHFQGDKALRHTACACFSPTLYADPDRLAALRPAIEAALRETDALLDFSASATLDPRWAATLGRLSRADLPAVRLNLGNLLYKAQAIGLLRDFFPAALAGIKLDETWPQILNAFLRHVERAGWFEVNWPLLDWLWEVWLEETDSTAECGLADYLTGIPLTCYGLTDDDLIEHPVLSVISALLGGDTFWTPDLDRSYPKITPDPDRLRLALQQADLSRYPDPIPLLPQAAMVVLGETGNFLLDLATDPADWWPHQFTWADDLERVKAAWAEAAPLIAAVRALCSWCAETPGYEREREITRVILEAGGYPVPAS